MTAPLKLLVCEYRRFTAVVLLVALLSAAAGLLGAALLYSDAPVDLITVAVVDNDNSLESRLALSVISSAGKGELLRLQRMGFGRAERMLNNGELNAVFVLPKGFVQSVFNGENLSVQAIYNPATPLSSMLVKITADSTLALLQAAQSGIYTALRYTEEHIPESYPTVYTRINARFIRAASAHSSTFYRREVYATGDVGATAYYLIHILIFLHLLSLPVLCSPMHRACNPAVLQSLHRLGRNGFYTAVPWALSYSLCLLPCLAIIPAIWLLAAGPLGLSISPMVLFCLPVLALLLGALSCLFALFFKHIVSSAFCSCLLACVSLLLSGGVIPLSYMPEPVSALARLIPQWRVYRMISCALNGIFDLVAFVALLGLIALLLLCIAVCAELRGRAARA